MRKIAQRMFAILLLLLPLTSLSLMAQLENGKVYNFVNYAKSSSLVALSMDRVSFVSTNESDYTQLWYAEADGQNRFTLRNLGNGLYLRSKASGAWDMVAENSSVDCHLYSVVSSGKSYISRTAEASGYDCMHCDINNGNIVSWVASDVKSEWNLKEVAVDAKTLAENWKVVDEILNNKNKTSDYQHHLDFLFTDKACTQLKVSSVENNEHYQALPVALQQMALKVQNQNWGEKNGDPTKKEWDSDYAKKFRVQLYEAYCDPEEASKALGINPHSNLNNPTGLYANYRDVLYIMVEGQIKAGASLYLASTVGHNLPDRNYRNGVQLHEGLNIVPFWYDGNELHVNYVVETFKDGKMTAHKLSQYDPLKIHIEGGHINGYFNAVGDFDAKGKTLSKPDTNTDWQYYEERANLEDFVILGKYQTIKFYMNSIEGADAYGNKVTYNGLSHFFPESDVNAVMAEWDRIMMTERLTMGLLSKDEIDEANAKYPTLDDKKRGIYAYTGNDGYDKFGVDYSDAYRLHGLSYGMTTGYMHGADIYSGYNISTFDDIIGRITTEAGSTWGPAHEIGHQHQRLINMNGLTEVSNNVFSNVAVWYKGLATSRVNGGEGAFYTVANNYNNENNDFFNNYRWAMNQLNYKLWMYYHLAGHNNKFYPRLFEILRRQPMTISNTQDASKCLLHYYKMCSLAAGEDLTDFFRAYGYFKPMTNRAVDDYSKSYYTMSQEQIDAAIKEVKSWGFPVNKVMVFINDATSDVTYGHDGTTPRQIWDGNATSEVGCYKGFYLGQESMVTGTYTYTVDKDEITVTGGQNAVGFAVYDDNKILLSFSDKHTFGLSQNAKDALAMGKAKVYAANGNNTLVEVSAINGEANQRIFLNELLTKSQNLCSLIDGTRSKVGHCIPNSVSDLQKSHDAAQLVYNANKGGYAEAYVQLLSDYNKLKNDKVARLGIKEGVAYFVTNRRTQTNGLDQRLAISGDAVVMANSANDDSQKWYFEGSNGIYFLKNKANSKRINLLEKDKNASLVDANNAEFNFRVVESGEGSYYVQCLNEHANYLNATDWKDKGYPVIGWNQLDDASLWYLQVAETDPLAANKAELEVLIQQTNDLINECGSLISGGKIDLQIENPNFSGYLSSNADQNTGGGILDGDGVRALLDNNVATYFHSRWGGNEVHEAHYLQVDLGADMNLSEFKFSYATRNDANSSPAPTEIKVLGSVDGKVYSDLVTLTSADGLLPYTEAGKIWKSQSLNANNSRYLRFVVTDSKGPMGGGENTMYGGQHFFALAEFGLEKAGDPTVKINDGYSEVSENLMVAAYNEVNAASKTLNEATTAQQIVASKEALQIAYDALLEARNASFVQYTLKISEYGYAGLYLKKNAIVPSGAIAYIVSKVNPTSVSLLPVEDGVVPANTGVIVKANQGEYVFNYTDKVATATSLLKGSVTTQYVKGEPNMNYYLFGVKNGKVGLYKAWLQYRADGTQSADMKNTDNGGYFKVSANKVYLPESASVSANSLFFIFDDITGIEHVATDSENAKIYDLQGRRVNKVQKSGLYIVNGQKRFVKI